MMRGATALALAPEALSELEEPEFESVVVPMSLRVTIVELKGFKCAAGPSATRRLLPPAIAGRPMRPGPIAPTMGDWRTSRP